MTNLTASINQVNERLAAAARDAGRSARDITLLAVSKGQPAAAIRAARQLGLRDFGENYLQEALAKIAALDDLGIDWHFIGPVQSNKTRAVAEQFAWVHSVDRLKIAQRLSAQRPAAMAPLNICIQVNIDGAAGKSGVAPDAVAALAEAVAGLPGLRLRGLMAIPDPAGDPQGQRAHFFHLAQLLATLRTRGSALGGLDTLSMGMSDDLEAAIAEGATLVRVGTAIFGSRQQFLGD
ncbi:MAG: YggS family pyridoxal phosphate-dependent enzyme [Porticoccaceae bacterium]